MKAIYRRGAGSAQVLILQAVPLEAFYAHKGLYTGKRQLADNAIYLERELLQRSRRHSGTDCGKFRRL